MATSLRRCSCATLLLLLLFASYTGGKSNASLRVWANDAAVNEVGGAELSCFWSGASETLDPLLPRLHVRWEHVHSQSNNVTLVEVTPLVGRPGGYLQAQLSYSRWDAPLRLGKHRCQLLLDGQAKGAPGNLNLFAAPFLDPSADEELRLGPELLDDLSLDEPRVEALFSHDRSIKLPQGSVAFIPCQLLSHPSASPEWFYRASSEEAWESLSLDDGTFARGFPEEAEKGECRHHCLRIANISKASAGLYSCRMENAFALVKGWDEAKGEAKRGDQTGPLRERSGRLETRLRVGGGGYSGLVWPLLGIFAELIATAAVIAGAEWSRRRQQAKEEEEDDDE